MESGISSNTIIALSLFTQMLGLLFVVMIDPYLSKRNRKIMLAIIATTLALIFQNIVGHIFDVSLIMPFARTVVGIIGYCTRPLILVLFLMIVAEKNSIKSAWMLIGINTIMYITALFSGITFSIDESNNFHRGPLGYMAHVVSGILLVYLLLYSLRKYRGGRRAEGLIPILAAAVITIAVLVDVRADYKEHMFSLLTIAVVTGSVFFYIWLHLKFVRAHEQSLYAEQRIQIMMSQIQPHFLYNTLSTIQALCRTDPKQAEMVTERFGTYLRQNLESLQEVALIPIEKEIEHVKVYAEIEEVRFPNITVTYDIGDKDFYVPSLSVQPLVENAIRHGVRGREDGHITVSTYSDGDCHRIRVSDNGKGLDMKKMETMEDKGDVHIGIRNVRERIERMCGGMVTITSDEGDGTCVDIRIPIGGG